MPIMRNMNLIAVHFRTYLPIQDLNRSQAIASLMTYKNKWCKTGIYFYTLLFILRLLLMSRVISLALGKRL